MALRHIFPKYYNKNVEVSLLNGKVFSGIFKYNGDLDIFTIIPTNKLSKTNYGDIHFATESIIHIREIYEKDDTYNETSKDSIINDIKHMLEELFKRN